jgi:phospholipid transport system substrate-binding protein
MKGEGKADERRAAVRQIANEIFDFGEIARRSLGRYWQPLSDAQRTEFVGLFGDLLERSYISKIELYGGEKIVYSGERMDGDPRHREHQDRHQERHRVPIDYRLFGVATAGWSRRQHQGISLVSNYRTQFNKIIQSNGYNTGRSHESQADRGARGSQPEEESAEVGPPARGMAPQS